MTDLAPATNFIPGTKICQRKYVLSQKKRSFFKRMWDSARHSLSSIFRRNKTEKIEDINDANDRKIAENLAFDIKTGKQGWNRAGSDISWYCLRALDDALNANEWENQAALFA